MVIIPDDYKGREQSLIKHTLLRQYLVKLFMIIGRHEKRICYVDCFSGPWQAESEDMHDTSVAISLEIMKGCKQSLLAHSKDVHFRALFIEKDAKAHGQLEEFLSRDEWGQIETKALHGDFYNLRPDICNWCNDGSFAFFFIDPTGWKEVVEIETLMPLLQRNKSEYLINFMFDFIRRSYPQNTLEEHMKAIFSEVPNISHLSVDEREEFLIQLYQDHLKINLPTTLNRARSTCVKVLYPEKDRTFYYLVYLTRHPLGIIEFVEESEKAEFVQRQVRAEVKQNRRISRTGQTELWGPEALADISGKTIDLSKIKEYWLDILSDEPKRIGVEQMANMIEETGWFISNFQVALAELISEGKVRNLDASRIRPKNVVDFSKNKNAGEFLQRLIE